MAVGLFLGFSPTLVNLYEKFLKHLKVVTGDSTGNISVYSIASMSLLTKFAAHTGSIIRLKYLSNGFLASASNQVKIWDTTTWSLVTTFTGHQSQSVYGIESINSSFIVTGGYDKIAKIWNVNTGGTTFIKSFTFPSEVLCIKMINESHIAFGLANPGYNLAIFNINSGESVANLTGQSEDVYDLELLSQQYLASGTLDNKVIIWNLFTSSKQYTLLGHASTVTSLKLISSSLLASASADSKVIIWNWNTGTLVTTLLGHGLGIDRSLDLISSMGMIVSGSKDKTIKFWQVSTLTLAQTLTADTPITSLITLATSSISSKKFKS